MLYAILYPLASHWSAFNVFKYITFRAFGAVIFGVILSMALGPWLIRKLKEGQIGQQIRDDGPKSHLSKKGTPTMGGFLILVTVILSSLLWCDLKNQNVWILVITFGIYGWVGWLDDYRKVKKKNTKGLSARHKLVLQWGLAFGLAWWIREANPHVYMWGDQIQQLDNTHVFFPLLKNFHLDLGPWIILFNALVIVGASNAVNLTDGLDGLATGPTITVSSTLALLLYCAGNQVIARYLQIPFLPHAGETAVVAATVVAGAIGFLWFNSYPAQVFMGDIGSLSLGAGIGVLSILGQNQLLLLILGGVFVLEAVSVIAQVVSFKTTGKRVLKMAPIHHHFELKGWPEPKVIVRFWIISILLAILSLATLKLR